MKRKIIFRCLLGAPIGLAINCLVTILISVIVGDGNYYPVIPELAEEWGSEMNAVLLQTSCSLLYGMMWGGLSVIWKIESWSLLRMTVTHLALCFAGTLPVAYLLRWMPRNLKGVLLYFGIFLAIYLSVWISQYYGMKKRVEQLNRKVQEGRQR